MDLPLHNRFMRVGFFAFVSLIFTGFANAQIVVNTLEDETTANATTSLREAITAANAGGNQTITFDATVFNSPDSIITLTQGMLMVNASMTIQGNLAAIATVPFQTPAVVIDGNGASRVMYIGTVAPSGDVTVSIDAVQFTGGIASSGGALRIDPGDTVTISNSFFQNNEATGAAATEGGGAIFSQGNLTVSSSIFLQNTATGTNGNGGAILSDDADAPEPTASLTISGSGFVSNTARRAGGAIENTGSLVNITNSNLSENQILNNNGANVEGEAGGNGGAVHSASGTVTITGGSVSDNLAGSEGGGLWNGGSGTMNIVNVDVSGNVSNGQDTDDEGSSNRRGGGGIFNLATMTITDGSVSGNDALGLNGNGGGIMHAAGTLSITNTAITNNFAARAGGGVEIQGANSTATLTNVQIGGDATPDDGNQAEGNDSGFAPGNGGGLHNAGSTVTIDGGFIIGNFAAKEGGGAWNRGGTMTISNGTIVSGNSANASSENPLSGGGGLFNLGNNSGAGDPVSSVLNVSDAIIANNTVINSMGNGGGVMTSGDGAVTTLTDTTINANSAPRAGGGIENQVSGVTNLVRTDVGAEGMGNSTGSTPGNGGGLHNAGGTVSIDGGSLVGNSAVKEGGGLWNRGGTVTIIGGTLISGNSADASSENALSGGGGLFNLGNQGEGDAVVSILNVTGASISGNSVTNSMGNGGGVMTSGNGAETTLTDTTIVSNTAPRAGGGIENQISGVTNLVRTDVGSEGSGNATGSTPGNGGGLHNAGGTVTIDAGSLSGNTAVKEGGGLWNRGGTVTITNGTVISGNSAEASSENTLSGGGGLFNLGNQGEGDPVASILNVTGATISGNSVINALGNGGGVMTTGAGAETTITDSVINSNTAPRAGGGVENQISGLTSLVRTTVGADGMGNTTGPTPGNGGGIHNGGGTVTVLGGSISGNTAALEGGGFWNNDIASVGLDGETGTVIALNTAEGGAGAVLDENQNVVTAADTTRGGGGLFNLGTMDVLGATIDRNVASGAVGNGGGAMNRGNGTADEVVLTLTNTIITANTANRAGGGVENQGAGRLDITGGEISGNLVGPSPGNGGGVHSASQTVNITGVDIIRNTASREGGGVWNGGGTATMTLTDVYLFENVAEGASADQGGGGAFNQGGIMVFDNTDVIDNDALGAAGSGGGLLNEAGTVTIRNGSLFSGNDAARAGGAIEDNSTDTANADQGNIAIVDSAFIDNFAGSNPGNGGAIHITGNGILTADNSSFTENIAAKEGGGLWNHATSNMTLTNITVFDNTAPDGAGLFAQAGAGILTVNNSTINANAASTQGGGISAPSGANVVVTNSIVANNTAPTGADVNATVLANFTLIEDQSTGLAFADGSGNNIMDDPGLGEAVEISSNNTLVFPLTSANGPAVDAGDNASCATVDQAGNTRPADGDGDGTATCDLGSSELADAPVVTITVDGGDGGGAPQDITLQAGGTADALSFGLNNSSGTEAVLISSLSGNVSIQNGTVAGTFAQVTVDVDTDGDGTPEVSQLVDISGSVFTVTFAPAVSVPAGNNANITFSVETVGGASTASFWLALPLLALLALVRSSRRGWKVVAVAGMMLFSLSACHEDDGDGPRDTRTNFTLSLTSVSAQGANTGANVNASGLPATGAKVIINP